MITPRDLAEKRERLASEYGILTDELADILSVKATRWTAIRAECRSDKAADKIWDSTEEGLREMRLRLKLKAYDKHLSSMASMLRILEAEYRNQI